MKKRYDSKFKAQVGIQAIKEAETMAELLSKFEVHRIVIERWKRLMNEKPHQSLGYRTPREVYFIRMAYCGARVAPRQSPIPQISNYVHSKKKWS